MKLFFALAVLPTVVGFSSNPDELTCESLQAAFDAAKTRDVEMLMYPFEDIYCENFTTFTLDSGYDIKMLSSDNVENYGGDATMRNLRFDVSGGSKITVEVNMKFELQLDNGDEYPDVDGGALHIGKDSSIVFLNGFKSSDVGVRSQTVEDSDFPDHQNYGGVVWNDGYFRVNGYASFSSCENSGGGEGSPGPGGCVYNSGSVLFKGGVEMMDVSILDDEGNNGAGIYNIGKVNIKGDSKFQNMRAETAGAIYNAEGGAFRFRSGANVIFDGCRSSDGNAGAISNSGTFRFSGPALFVECASSWTGGAIVNLGDMKLSKDSVFFKTRSGDTSGAPVYVSTGGVFDYDKSRTYFIESSAYFFGEVPEVCDGVFFADGEVCDE